MNGVEYFRKKCRLSKRELAQCSGVTEITIRTYERTGVPDNAPVEALVKLSEVLGVTLDELLAEFDHNSLTTNDRKIYRSGISAPENIVNNYRIRHNLRLQELAERLQLGSREGARKACRRKTARKEHIRRLCEVENLSPESFESLYGSK